MRIETIIARAKRMRSEGLAIAAIETHGDKVTYRLGEPLDSNQTTGDPAFDEFLNEGREDGADRAKNQTRQHNK